MLDRMRDVPHYWFKRRRYGYGWIPVTWQGWLALAIYLVVVVGGAFVFLDAPQNTPEGTLPRTLGSYLAFVAVAAVAFLAIVRSKAPKARWRWGRKPDDDPAEDF